MHARAAGGSAEQLLSYKKETGNQAFRMLYGMKIFAFSYDMEAGINMEKL